MSPRLMLELPVLTLDVSSGWEQLTAEALDWLGSPA
jgi:hypothetical protein